MRAILRFLGTAVIGWWLYSWLDEWLSREARVEEPDAVVTFVNRASAEALERAGVARGPRAALLAARPFASVDELAATSGIGPKTLEALVHAAT